MRIVRSTLILASAVAIMGAGVSAAQANCVRKGAEATAGDEKSAKWFALETMVQSVSWGLWPSFVANGSTPGYRITKQRYRCSQSGLGVTCRGAATFCKTS
ncbi:MAG: hypothetical protein AAFQ45_05015 [Pseudomonadota bacterium]